MFVFFFFFNPVVFVMQVQAVMFVRDGLGKRPRHSLINAGGTLSEGQQVTLPFITDLVTVQIMNLSYTSLYEVEAGIQPPCSFLGLLVFVRSSETKLWFYLYLFFSLS